MRMSASRRTKRVVSCGPALDLTLAEHPLRICVVAQAIYPDVVGGAPIAVHDNARLLAEAGHMVEVHTVEYPGRANVEPKSYRLFRHRRLPGPWNWIGTAGNPWGIRLAQGVLNSRAQIVHLHSHLFFTSFQGARAAKRMRAPYVLTVHGMRARRGWLVNAAQEFWIQTMGRWILRGAASVICLNQADAAEVQRYGVRPDRVVLGFNMVSSIFQPGTGVPKPQVIWTGRHVAEKGVEDLLRAWPRVSVQFPEHVLALVGEGPLEPRMKALADKLGIAQHVRFLPFIPQTEVARILSESCLFVMPSIQEGQPLSLLEAMACGLPVVATPCVADLAGRAGRIVAAQDPTALAQAIIELLADPNAARLGRAGQAFVRSQLGEDRLLSLLENTYAKALRLDQSIMPMP